MENQANQDNPLVPAGQADPAKRDRLIGQARDLGFELEKAFRGCAQCTLAALFELSGQADPALFQAASGLSAGIGLNGDGCCGGYTGGVLYMGSRIGRRLDHFKTDGDVAAKQKSYAMAQRLHDRFVETYGSVTCAAIHREIFGQSYCLREPGVSEAFEQAGAHVDKCTSVVGNACAWTTEILLDEGLL